MDRGGFAFPGADTSPTGRSVRATHADRIVVPRSEVAPIWPRLPGQPDARRQANRDSVARKRLGRLRQLVGGLGLRGDGRRPLVDADFVKPKALLRSAYRKRSPCQRLAHGSNTVVAGTIANAARRHARSDDRVRVNSWGNLRVRFTSYQERGQERGQVHFLPQRGTFSYGTTVE